MTRSGRLVGASGDAPPQSPAMVVLAGIYVVNGLLCLAGAAAPVNRDSPVRLLAVLGVAGVVGGGGLYLLRRSASGWLIHGGLLVASLLVGLLGSESVTPQGVVGLGPLLIVIGLYVAHFLPVRLARVHVVVAMVASTCGAFASGVRGIWMPWTINMVAVALVGAVHGALSRRLRQAADRDVVTGLLNRRAWREAAGRAVARAERHGGPLTVVLIDLDNFKAVNDQGGHHAGDHLLRELAEAWTGQLRVPDVLSRYGGDEFALLLPDTDLADAAHLIARLGAAHPSRWSVGSAEWEPGKTPEELLRAADTRLYCRKRERGAV